MAFNGTRSRGRDLVFRITLPECFRSHPWIVFVVSIEYVYHPGRSL